MDLILILILCYVSFPGMLAIFAFILRILPYLLAVEILYYIVAVGLIILTLFLAIIVTIIALIQIMIDYLLGQLIYMYDYIMNLQVYGVYIFEYFAKTILISLFIVLVAFLMGVKTKQIE